MSNELLFECRGVEKIFHDGTRELRILRGIDFEVRRGETVVITGPSGVGKSTLLHIVGTLDRPSAGEVLFRGKTLQRLSAAELNAVRNREIGFVFQFYHLLPEFTAFENVMMPSLVRGASRKACAARAEELLNKVGLADRMTHKPGRLSGGEQQRVAIARALFNRPAVILADEPTGNLDEGTGAGVIELLWGLNQTENVTLVAVTHDEALSQRADRWVHLRDGRAQTRKG